MTRAGESAGSDEAAWVCLALEVETERDEQLAPEHIERLAGSIRDTLELAFDVTHGHRFEPIGFSLMAFGAAGRLAIHTWPEFRFATIDLWLGAPWLQARRAQLAAMLAAQGYRIAAAWLVQSGTPPIAEEHVEVRRVAGGGIA